MTAFNSTRQANRRVCNTPSIGRVQLSLLAIILVLAGCGTTAPTNYYMLSASLGSPSDNQSPSLGIGPIEIPEYLNRNGLIYNRDGNQLQIANYERWAEPLSNGIERVLGLNLANLLETQNVQGFPWQRRAQPDYGIEVSILLLDANDQRATLVAEWALQKPAENIYLGRRQVQLTYAMPTGESTPEKIAPAYSDLLLQLSEEIATVIKADLVSASH
jgi:uncharacterized protein